MLFFRYENKNLTGKFNDTGYGNKNVTGVFGMLTGHGNKRATGNYIG